VEASQIKGFIYFFLLKNNSLLQSHVESLKEAEQEQITSMRALCEKKKITLEIKTTSEKLRENEALEISPEFHPINIVIGQQTPEDLAAKTGYKLGVQ
jgi:septum formation inhibitor MinC